MQEVPSVLMLICAIAWFAYAASESAMMKHLAVGIYVTCSVVVSILLLGMAYAWVGVAVASALFIALLVVNDWASRCAEADVSLRESETRIGLSNTRGCSVAKRRKNSGLPCSRPPLLPGIRGTVRFAHLRGLRHARTRNGVSRSQSRRSAPAPRRASAIACRRQWGGRSGRRFRGARGAREIGRRLGVASRMIDRRARVTTAARLFGREAKTQGSRAHVLPLLTGIWVVRTRSRAERGRSQ